MSSSPAARRIAVACTALAVVVAGMVIGWGLAGPTESETKLGRVSFEIAPDLEGRIDAFVPIADWGLRTNSFDGPFELRVEVRAVDRAGALAAASEAGEALRGLEEELERGARSAVIRGFLWGLATTLVLALIIWLAGRNSRFLRLLAYASAIGALLATVASLAWAALSFDAKSFSDPSFYGRGEELAQLLAFFERQQDNDRYTSTFEGALANFTAYLSDAPRTGEAGGTTLIFASDLHNNAPILSTLKGFGGDDPVILAGDFAHEGNEAEARLVAPRIAALGSSVIAVSGNHDSHGLMRALAGEGVTVLEQEGRLRDDGATTGSPLYEVGELSFAGFADPLEWQGENPGSPERIFSFSELEDGVERQQQAEAELVAWFDSLPREPDVVIVHQSVLAQHLASTLADAGYARPLTIITGHNHYQEIDRYGEIVVVNAGTLGAGGILRVGQEFAGLGELHLDETDGSVRSVDLIRVEPLSGQAEADRVVIDIVCPAAESSDEPCHYEAEEP